MTGLRIHNNRFMPYVPIWAKKNQIRDLNSAVSLPVIKTGSPREEIRTAGRTFIPLDRHKFNILYSSQELFEQASDLVQTRTYSIGESELYAWKLHYKDSLATGDPEKLIKVDFRQMVETADREYKNSRYLVALEFYELAKGLKPDNVDLDQKMSDTFGMILKRLLHLHLESDAVKFFWNKVQSSGQILRDHSEKVNDVVMKICEQHFINNKDSEIMYEIIHAFRGYADSPYHENSFFGKLKKAIHTTYFGGTLRERAAGGLFELGLEKFTVNEFSRALEYFEMMVELDPSTKERASDLIRKCRRELGDDQSF